MVNPADLNYRWVDGGRDIVYEAAVWTVAESTPLLYASSTAANFGNVVPLQVSKI